MSTKSIVRGTRSFAARQRGRRLRLALAALCCALFGTACMTSSILTSVTHTDDGQNLVGQSMSMEFSKKVWDALDPEDRKSLTDFPDELKKEGWSVTTSDGGRIINGTKDPVDVHDLTKRGWSVNEQALDAGSIITATLPSLSIFGAASGDASNDLIRNIVLVIDQSDPKGASYTFSAEAHVDLPQDTSTPGAEQQPPPPSGSGEAQSLDEWFALIDQEIMNDPKIKKLEQALKDAGPPKFTLGVGLPAGIQSATINGSPGGDVSGNQVQWTIPLVQSGTYNLEARAGGPSNLGMKVEMASEYANSEAHIWPFGKHAGMRVRVYPWDKASGQAASMDPTKFHPIQVKLFYDGQEVGNGQTNVQSEAVEIDFTPPDDTPEGLTQHQFKAVASKQGFETTESTMDFEVARGLQSVTVSVDGIGGVHPPNETITIKGQVWAEDSSGSFTSPVPATITIAGPGGSAVGTTDGSGYFSVDLTMNATDADVVFGSAGIWVTATPMDKDHFYKGEGYVQVRIGAKGTLSISASTNKVVYGSDESVTISGLVTADAHPVAASVEIVVDGSVLIGTAQAGDDGRYEYTFLPSSVPTSPQNPGQVPPSKRNPKPGSSPPNSNPVKPIKVSSTYVVTVTPNASGYLAGPDGAAYFNVTRTDDGCRAEEMQLSQVAGNVYAQLGDAQSNGLNASAISTLQVGMSVSQGMQVFTHDSSRATFALPLGGDNQAAVAINGRTTIEIGAYCRDSSGKLHIVLRASKPGQVLVKWPPNANADIKITTPAGDVSSVHTRYFISVDVDGATSLIGLEGTARFTDSQGGSVDVDAGKRVTVTEGQRVSGMIPVAVQGQVDPRLVAMLEPAGTAASFGASNTSSSTGSGSFDLATYSPWLIAAGAGILLLAVVYGFALTRSRSRKQVPMSAPPAMPPMPIMPVVDPFASVAAQYQWMRGEMAAGRMSLQQCNAMLAGMTVRDVYGRTWMLNGNDGHWLVYDGRQWIYANPYQPG